MSGPPANGNPSGNVNNHVDGYHYDAAGDVTTDSLNQYAYDGEGRLCAAYSGGGVYTEYIYDAEGNRVAKGSASDLSCNPASDGFAMTNRYIIGPTGQQLSEMNGSGGWLHTNVFAGGKLLATYGGTDTYFALTDWLGTKRVETDSAGNTISTSYSLPFGDNLVVNGGPDATEHHFTGREHDSNTGNDYFLARYYNSATGRFLSPDWSKNPEGVPYADFSDPQSLNLYDYMRNSPLDGVDKDGHCGSGGFWCHTWNRIKADVNRLNNSTNLTVEAGVGEKESVKVGSVEIHAGGSVHVEKTYGPNDTKLKGGAPIKEKAEVDAGAKVGKVELSGEAGLEHSKGEGIHPYLEHKGSLGFDGSGESSIDGKQISFGVVSYDIFGGGVTVSTNQKAFFDLIGTVSTAVDHLITGPPTQ